MKVTNAELMNAQEPMETLGKKQLPVKVALALSKLSMKLNEHLVPALKVKDGLVRQYGHEIKVANKPPQIGLEPGDENWTKFCEEYAELLNFENEIVFEKVLIPDTVELDVATAMALEKFIKV